MNSCNGIFLGNQQISKNSIEPQGGNFYSLDLCLTLLYKIRVCGSPGRAIIVKSSSPQSQMLVCAYLQTLMLLAYNILNREFFTSYESSSPEYLWREDGLVARRCQIQLHRIYWLKTLSYPLILYANTLSDPPVCRVDRRWTAAHSFVMACLVGLA